MSSKDLKGQLMLDLDVESYETITGIGEKLTLLINLASDYISLIGDSFVSRQMATLSNNGNGIPVYNYRFTLPENIKLSVMANENDIVKYLAWFNYTPIEDETKIDEILDLSLMYMNARINKSIEEALKKIRNTFKKDFNIKEQYE